MGAVQLLKLGVTICVLAVFLTPCGIAVSLGTGCDPKDQWKGNYVLG